MVTEQHNTVEDRKPQSDEARSAFAPPEGVEQPQVPEEDSPRASSRCPPDSPPR